MSALGSDLLEPPGVVPAAERAGKTLEAPRWARARPSPAPAVRSAAHRPLLALGVAAVAITVGGLAANTHHFVMAGQALIVAAFAVSIFFLLRANDSELKAVIREREADRRRADIYDRAGMSIWREDWSEVGRRILDLRAQGVTNVAQWLDARPEEKKALHASVKITDVNQYTLELMGAADKAQLIGSLATVLPGSEKTFSRWVTALSRGDEIYVAESRVRRLDGSPLDCLVTAALPTNLDGFGDVIVSIIEISEYKRDQGRLAEAESEVARAQRIATVGALTASIAHEVNSPLAAITSNAGACLRWLQRDVPNLEEAEDAARSVIAEAERAQGVIERTRSFLSRSTPKSIPLVLGDLVKSSADLVYREAHNHEVLIQIDIAPALPAILGDPIQMQQILVNLMLNGIQAMATSRHPRVLRVEAALNGGYVSVVVSDTGPGIGLAELKNVFQPFYSTKDQGMGMGLAISRSCVEAHGGTMWMASEPGHGAAVHFTLAVEEVAQ